MDCVKSVGNGLTNTRPVGMVLRPSTASETENEELSLTRDVDFAFMESLIQPKLWVSIYERRNMRIIG